MILLKSGYADAFVWDYEQGEGVAASFWQEDCLSTHSTLDKLLAKISSIAGFSVKASDLSITASNDIANITVSGLYTVSILGDYIYCDNPKKTDKLFEIIYTFSVMCFDFKPVDSLATELTEQGAELIE